MALETYLHPENAPELSAKLSSGEAPLDNGALDDLIGRKSQVQAQKLDVLAAELRWRLHIAAQNLHTLDQDRGAVHEMLNDLTVAANYRLREHQEKAPLYRRLFEIEAEERSQRTECWRDLANVMRDFLGVWEAHEQARARAIFLTDVGTGTS